MVDKRVNLIEIFQNGKFELNSDALENLFLNLDCKISILTIINETANADFQLTDYILRYLINGGIPDWIYQTNHEKFLNNKNHDAIMDGVKVWPKPFFISKYCGQNKVNEKIAVILMEVNLDENVDKDVKYKLINFTKVVSSEIVVNCRKEIKGSLILSLTKSFEYESGFNGFCKNLRFLVREWESSVNKMLRYGEKGGMLYFKSILNDVEIPNVEKYFPEIRCFLMPALKGSRLFNDRALSEYNIAFVRNIGLFINNLLDSDGLSVSNLNSLQLMEKIKAFINSGDPYPQCTQDHNSNENHINKNQSKNTQSLPKNKPETKPKPDPKSRLKPKPELKELNDKVNGVEHETYINLDSIKPQNFDLFAEECKQIYKNSYENNLNEIEMKSNFENIRNILTTKFREFTKNSNIDYSKIQFESLLSELFKQSVNKMRSDIKEFENYIFKEKNGYINTIIENLNKDNLLNYEEIVKLHTLIKENKLRSFDEFSKNYKSTESFRKVLIEKLDEEYLKIEFSQQTFVKFINLIVSKFNDSKYLEPKNAEKFFNEKRKEFIKEISSETDKDLIEKNIKIFDEKLAFFQKYNNDNNSKENEIVMKNISSLISMYSKKLSEEIEKDLFTELENLENYNKTLVDVCIESLNAGHEFKDDLMKTKFENELRNKLSEEFVKIKALFQKESNIKIIEKSTESHNRSTTSESSNFTETFTSENSTNNNKSLIKTEVTSLAKNQGLSNQNISLQENKIENSYEPIFEKNAEIGTQLISSTVIAIDFGTCNVRVGYFKDNQIKFFKAIPNYVGFNGKQILIGGEAMKFAAKNPTNVIFHSKLFLGGSDLNFYQEELYPFGVYKSDGFNYFIVNFDGEKTVFSCEEIIAFVLKNVKEMCESELGTKISKCVITVPNSFNDSQREAMKISARIAGFEDIKLINDITAASISLQKDVLSQRKIIIASSGSSSFSIALMNLYSSENIIKIETLKSDHVLNCSGIGIDNELMKGSNLRDRSEYFELRKSFVERREKVLLNSYSNFYKKNLSEFSKLVNNKYQDFILDLNKNYLEGKFEIFLIGGYFKFKFFGDIHPQIRGAIIESDDIVVAGAAVYAHSLRTNIPANERKIEIKETLNLTISTKDLLNPIKTSFLGKFFNNSRNEVHKFFIPRNTSFTNSIEISRDVYYGDISVYQGELVFPNKFKNQRIGKFHINSNSKRYSMSFKLTMNDEGIISIDAYENNGQLLPIKFCKFKFSEEKVQSCLEKFNKIFGY